MQSNSTPKAGIDVQVPEANIFNVHSIEWVCAAVRLVLAPCVRLVSQPRNIHCSVGERCASVVSTPFGQFGFSCNLA